MPPEAETLEASALSRSYLVQPRGPGTSYQFRMRTPADLIGRLDPTSGKPFGAEVKRGLRTRDLRTAGARAAILKGQIMIMVERLVSAVSGLSNPIIPVRSTARSSPPAAQRLRSIPNDSRGSETALVFRRILLFLDGRVAHVQEM